MTEKERELDPDLVELLNNLAKVHGYREGSLLGVLIGGFVLLGGFAMFYMGISGSANWLIEAGGLKSRITNASPGAVFSLIGFFVMLKYKPKVKVDIELKKTKEFEPGTSSPTNESTQLNYKSAASSGIQPIEKPGPGRHLI